MRILLTSSPLALSNISHSHEDNGNIFNRDTRKEGRKERRKGGREGGRKVQTNNRVPYCVESVKTFILITFLEGIRKSVRREIKK